MFTERALSGDLAAVREAYAPDPLHRYAGGDFTVGLPGDGGVAWTTQTAPACVLVKPRLETSPPDFVDFLVAEALVQTSLDEPEGFPAFFGERYRDLAAVTDGRLGPSGTYQLACSAVKHGLDLPAPFAQLN